MAATAKEKAIADALFQHYLKHPLSEVVVQIDGEAVPGATDGIAPELRGYFGYASINSGTTESQAAPPSADQRRALPAPNQ